MCGGCEDGAANHDRGRIQVSGRARALHNAVRLTSRKQTSRHGRPRQLQDAIRSALGSGRCEVKRGSQPRATRRLGLRLIRKETSGTKRKLPMGVIADVLVHPTDFNALGKTLALMS